jgi:hypothetical protein
MLVPRIDDIVVQDSYTISMNVNTASGNGNYLVGEYVHNSTNTAFGLCTFWDVSVGVIKITDLVWNICNLECTFVEIHRMHTRYCFIFI